MAVLRGGRGGFSLGENWLTVGSGCHGAGTAYCVLKSGDIKLRGKRKKE